MRSSLTAVIAAAATFLGCGPGDSQGDRHGGRQLSSANGPLPFLPLSWSVPTWFVDPANLTGAASDGNACSSSAKPCLTFAGVADHWGTYSPRLRQNTTITFVSSHFDNTDPVYLTPLLENGAELTVQGVLGPKQQVATGTLSNVVSKNRSTAQLLEATLPVGAGVGRLVANNTRSSRAWVYRNGGGPSWFLSQPVATPPTAEQPAEDDAWANGDAIAIYDPVAVNLAELSPMLADDMNTTANQPRTLLKQLTVFDPAGAGRDNLTIEANSALFIVESSIQRDVDLGVGPADVLPSFVNVDFAGTVRAGLLSGQAPGVALYGGQVRSPAKFALVRGGTLDGDLIVGGAFQMIGGLFGTVFVDHGDVLSVIEGTAGATSSGAVSSQVVWGGGAVDVEGNARLEFPASANEAQVEFLEKGGLLIDGAVTACAVDTAGSGDWKCGIPLTPANLDTSMSAGGFGGTAANPGGASISNAAKDL